MAKPNFCDLREMRRLARSLARQAVRARRPGPEYVGRAAISDLPGELGRPPYGVNASWAEAYRVLSRTYGPVQDDRLGQLLDRALRRPDGSLLLDPDTAWRRPDIRQKLIALASLPDQARRRAAVAELLEGLGLEFRAMAVRHPGLVQVVRLLGHQDRPVPAYRRRVYSVRPDASGRLDPELAALLREVAQDPANFPRLAERLNDPSAAEIEAADRLGRFWNEVYLAAHQHGLTPPRTVGEVYAAFLPALPEDARESLLSRLRPLAVTTEDLSVLTRQEFERALDEDLKELFDRLKREHGPLVASLIDLIARVRDFSREVGVFRPLFWLEQFIQDSVVKPWLSGIRNAPLAAYREYRAYWATWKKALDLGISPETLWESGVVPRTAGDLVLFEHGVDSLPHELSSAFERAFQTRELRGYTAEESAIWGLPGMARLRDAAWGASGRLGDQVLKLLGLPARAYAEASALVSLLARSQEMATRKAIFVAGVERFMAEGGLETFLVEARALFDAHGLEASDFDAFATAFRQMSDRRPRELAELVLNQVPDRPYLAEQLTSLWGQVVEEAVSEALELTRRVNYDFLDRRTIDDLLGAVFRYHFWASRNLPFYLEELLRHYTAVRLWVRSVLASEREAEETGRPYRVGMALPLDLGPFDDLLFGQGARFYLDLWALVSVTSQFDPSIFGTSFGTPYDRLRSAAGSVGFSVNWDLAMLMALLGYDTRPDLPRLMPQTWMLGGGLGFEAFGPLGQAGYALRETVSGHLPFTRKVVSETLTGNRSLDRAVWLELVAQSARETGNPNHPRFQAAMGNPDDPLFQAALERVRRRRFAEALFNWVTPGIRAQVVGQEELVLRREGRLAAEAPELALISDEARSTLIALGDMAFWQLYLPSDGREAQIRSGWALDRLARADGMRPSPLYLAQRLPWFLAYRLWAAEQPPGSRSVNAYLQQVDAGQAPDPEALSASGAFDAFLVRQAPVPPGLSTLVSIHPANT